MSKHTPGPWAVKRLRDDGVTYIHAPSRDYFIATAHDWRSDPVEVWDEADANARLIAAAPSLADALRDLLGYLESPALHDAAVAIPRARAALALADGSKP
jgi:hypothetical protein